MGKARILQAHGEGRYTIEIIEARERAESAKQQAEARIQTLTAEVNQLDAKIQAAQQAVDQAALEQNAAIEQWHQEVAEQGGSSVDLDAFARKLLEATGKRDALRTEKRSKELRIAADQALVARINALPPLRQMQAWCADYTEDLSGEVATAEVPGEVGGVIIKPGFENANQWSATADGAIQPALAGTPASVFYNLAMKPGWQKWRPTYRTATITSIDGDTCSITLDAAASSQQGLNVNSQTSYSGVPILYMDCDGTAFEQGDRVLVAFAGNVEGPTVVGFESEPRACDIYIVHVSESAHRASYEAISSNNRDYPEWTRNSNPRTSFATSIGRTVNHIGAAGTTLDVYYSYSKKEDVAGISEIRDFFEGFDFLNANASRRLPQASVNLIDPSPNKKVSEAKLNKFDFNYEVILGGEKETRTAEITDYGVTPSGQFYAKTHNVNFLSRSVTDSTIQLTETDSPSAFFGMHATPFGSALMFSDELSINSVSFTLNTNISLNDYTERLEFKGRIYVRNRFINFTDRAPTTSLGQVYVEYVREDFVDNQP